VAVSSAYLPALCIIQAESQAIARRSAEMVCDDVAADSDVAAASDDAVRRHRQSVTWRHCLPGMHCGRRTRQQRCM